MKPQVLVVDDSVTVRMDLRSVLSTAGFNVTACETKAVALKMLRDRSFSLVVLDVALPDGSGIDVLKAVRSSANSAHTPIILLTNEAEVRHRIHGLTVGADEYISKPYDRSYLVLRASELVERPHAEAPAGEQSPLTGKKILVVDDSPTYRETLAEALRLDGCNVINARSGEEALELLAVETLDCVIVDLLMPAMNGLELIERIKGDPAHARTPVMLMTGLSHHAAEAEGRAVGADGFIQKSPELGPLKARLRDLLWKTSPPPCGASHTPNGLTRTARSSSPGPLHEERAAPGRADDPAPSSGPGSLFARVVEASGLSTVIGPSTLLRACRRAGVEPSAMSPADLHRALPAIHDTLRLFLHKSDYPRRVAALAVLARNVGAAAGV